MGRPNGGAFGSTRKAQDNHEQLRTAGQARRPGNKERHMAERLIRLDITAAEEDYEGITGLLFMKLSSGWEEQSLPAGETLFRAHCENAEVMDDIEACLGELFPHVEKERSVVEVEDWVTAWKDFFTPVPCGRRFVVLPPWLAFQNAWPDRKEIVIEPKSAFGTGHHATTALCLEALSDLLDRGAIREGQSFLDLGMGSGVLGMGLALEGLHGLGLDIDPLALDNARENCGLNHLSEDLFKPWPGSVEKVKGEVFDLVVANILAQPLIDMAGDIMALKAEGGALVLSGILTVQADRVAAAYESLGKPERRESGEWTCLVWA